MADLVSPAAFTDLEIRILQKQDQGYPVEITLGGQQEFPRGYLPTDVLPWTPSGDLVSDGQKLFETLFKDGTLRSAWAEARGRAQQRRIRFRIDTQAAELHALPWELLQENQTLLAAQADTPFSRYLPIALPWSGAVDQRPIKVLVAISDPDDLKEKYDLAQADVALERKALGRGVCQPWIRKIWKSRSWMRRSRWSASRKNCARAITFCITWGMARITASASRPRCICRTQMVMPNERSMMRSSRWSRGKACVRI